MSWCHRPPPAVAATCCVALSDGRTLMLRWIDRRLIIHVEMLHESCDANALSAQYRALTHLQNLTSESPYRRTARPHAGTGNADFPVQPLDSTADNPSDDHSLERTPRAMVKRN